MKFYLSAIAALGIFAFATTQTFLWASGFAFNSALFLSFQTSLLLLTAGLGRCAFQTPTLHTQAVSDAFLQRIYALVLTANTLMLAIDPLIMIVESPALFDAVRVLLWLSVGCSIFILATVWRQGIVSGFAVAAVVLLTLICKILIPFISEHPPIDVFVWSWEAVQVLLRGQNPYAHAYVEMGTEAFGYSPVFPYLPGVLLILAPFQMLSLDIRLASIAADFGVLIFLGLLFKTCLKRTLAQAGLIAAVYFTLPTVFRVIELAWNDTLLLAALMAAVFLLATRRWTLALITMGFALSIKQYAIFAVGYLLVFAVTEMGLTRKTLMQVLRDVGGVAAVLIAPFYFWKPASFIHSVLEVPRNFPLRGDSYGVQGTLLRWGYLSVDGLSVVGWLFAIFWLLSLWRLSRTLYQTENSAMRLKVTITHIAVFSGVAVFFGHHSFLNHFYFASGWLLLASALSLNDKAQTRVLGN